MPTAEDHDHPTSGAAFLAESVRLLEEDHLPRLRVAVTALDPADLWWRPNVASNSVGNLLLHLAGNLRQWVVSGVGGEPDRRRRREEFEAEGTGDAAAILDVLEAAVRDATSVLQGMDPDRLGSIITVQGREATVLGAIYHAVEHFSMHVGQVLWIAKARSGRDLGLYVEGSDGHPRRNW